MITNITFSTVLTLSRIACVPFIVMYMLLGHWLIACILFTLAALTDLCDGALARYLDQETELGAYLDPIADKILLVSCYVTLMFTHMPFYKVPIWFVFLIMFKELVLVMGAFYLCVVKKVVAVKPTALGKLTTGIQVIFMWWLFASTFFSRGSALEFSIFLSIIATLTIAVLIQYAVIGFKGLEI